MQQTSPLEPLNRHLDSHVLTPITLLKTLRHHNQCSENLQPARPAAPRSPLPTASPGCTGQLYHSSSSDTPLVTSEKISPLSPQVSTLSDVALAAIPLLLPPSLAAILQSRWLLCTPMCALCWEVCPLPLIFICWLWSLSSFLSPSTQDSLSYSRCKPAQWSISSRHSNLLKLGHLFFDCTCLPMLTNYSVKSRDSDWFRTNSGV